MPPSAESGEQMPAAVATLFPGDSAARAAWQSANEYQRHLLRDGELTFSEYEGAWLAFSQCTADAGLTFLSEPTFDPTSMRFEYRVLSGRTAGESDSTDETLKRCEAGTVQQLRGAWTWLHRATEVEIQEGDAALRACLKDVGEDLASINEMPPYGSNAYFEWSMGRLEEERLNAGVNAPGWLICINQIETQYPLG